MSGVTTATVLAGVTAAAAVGSTAYSIASAPSKSSPAPTPTADTGDTNTSAAVSQDAAAAPGRAANIAAGNDSSSGSLNASADDQYSVKKKLLGD